MEKKLVNKIARAIRIYSDLSLARGLSSEERIIISQKFAICIMSDIKNI